jgi:exoribonuclease II
MLGYTQQTQEMKQWNQFVRRINLRKLKMAQLHADDIPYLRILELFYYLEVAHTSDWKSQYKVQIEKAKKMLMELKYQPTLQGVRQLFADIEHLVRYIPGDARRIFLSLTAPFTPEQIQQSNYIKRNYESIFMEERQKRRDLTHLKAYAIDNPGTTIVDDAVSIEAVDGIHRLYIHIADPSPFITKNSPLEQAMRLRMESLYFEPSYAVPAFMIPMDIGQRLGLRKDHYNVAISLILDMSPDCEVKNVKIIPSIISP